MDNFYKANEEITLRFYQMPKVLFSNPKYRGLSLGAKAMYSVLRDRLDLSIKNNWVDKEGNIYLIFKTEPAKDDNRHIDEKDYDDLSLTELLGINKNTITAYRKELTKYDLMIEKKLGQGKPNMIYILKPELPNESIENYKSPKKQDSKVLNINILDSQKLTGNDTYYNDTEYSDTIFLSPEKVKKENLPVDNLKDKREIEGIKKPNEFKQILEDSKYKDFEDKYVNAILQSIRLLYYSDKPLRINNMSIPPSQVREDLKMLRWKHIDLALRDFKIQSKNQEIQYPIGYLSRCIYNAIFQCELRVESDLLYLDLI